MYLRKVTIDDADLLFRWANDPVVRQNSFNSECIKYSEHVAWLNGVLNSSIIDGYILVDSEAVGTVRIKYYTNYAEISYSIGDKFRGKGYGARIIELAEQEVRKRDSAKLLVAEVKNENIASRKIFEKLQYIARQETGYIRFIKVLGEKRVAIRVDANPIVATGHAMRCMTVAERLLKCSISVVFFVADGASETFIANHGCLAVRLDSDYAALEEETDKLLFELKRYHINLLLIDSYYVTEGYFAQLAKFVKTGYIDDLLTFAYPVDFLINYNIYASREAYLTLYRKTSLPYLMIGEEYAPLRKEFQDVSHEVSDQVKNILITTGGADKLGIAHKIVDYLITDERLKDVSFHIVSGALANSTDGEERVFIHKDVKNMAKLISDCDVVISAGGFTLYEARACNVPIISISFADNQLKNVEAFDRLGLIPYAGDFRTNSIQVLKRLDQYIVDYMNSFRQGKIKFQKQTSLSINGAKKIAQEIKELL